MGREFSVVIDGDEDGYYVASVPALPGCHTQARSLDELVDRVREAIAAHLDVESDEAAELEIVGLQLMSVDGSRSPKFQALLNKSRRQIEETGGIPHDAFWREVEAERPGETGKGKPTRRRTNRRT